MSIAARRTAIHISLPTPNLWAHLKKVSQIPYTAIASGNFLLPLQKASKTPAMLSPHDKSQTSSDPIIHVSPQQFE